MSVIGVVIFRTQYCSQSIIRAIFGNGIIAEIDIRWRTIQYI
jgi:hypothetical protein